MSMLNTPSTRCVVLFVALTAWISGCGGKVSTTAPTSSSDQVTTSVQATSSDQVASPAPTSCLFSLSPSSVNYTASDSTGNVMVSTSANCSWMASSDVDWISVTGNVSGRGSGTVTYHVAQNTTSSERDAAIKVVATGNGDAAVLHQVKQFASTELRLRGAYTFVLEVDTDSTCGWPETKFYVPVYIEETSHAESTTTGSIKFPATQSSASKTWSIAISSTQTELVLDQQSTELGMGAYEVVVDGGSWVAGGLSQAPDGRGEIKGGTVSGANLILKLRDSDERWVCQSEAKWSLITRFTDKD